MTDMRRTPPRRAGGRSFTTSEGLRTLLQKLQDDDGTRWRTDRDAADLMSYAADRFAALARKHGLDPWEAAAAAFDVMRSPSTRRADDPWAVVTRAVQVTCIAEERARGLLCSVHQARRPRYSAFHDAERFSDREVPLADYHPAFHVDHAAADDPGFSPHVDSAVQDAIALFVLRGWPAELASTGVEYVCGRLTETSSRASAYEMLRRDHAARTLLDLPQPAWTAMLRTLLGSPDPALAHTALGRGILLRLLIGEPLRSLLADEGLVAAIDRHLPMRRA